MATLTLSQSTETRLYNVAFGLSLFTIFYNIVEGLASTWLGLQDETLALFGFGVDSFIETISGIGIAYMITRIRQNPDSKRAQFERTALRITGYSFFVLAAGLLVTGAVSLATHHAPDTTFWGVVISAASIVVMSGLLYAKLRVGRQLDSAPIIADANCTKVCLYMSAALLVSSGVFELAHIPFVDSLAAFVLAWFSYKEGRESLEKAVSEAHCACGHD